MAKCLAVALGATEKMVGASRVDRLGLERLRAGNDIYYSGLTGPMLLGACGPRQLGVTTTWQVSGGLISDR